MNPIKTKAYKLFRKGKNGVLLPYLSHLKHLGVEYKPNQLNKSPYGPIFIFKDLTALRDFASKVLWFGLYFEGWEVEAYGVKEAPPSIVAFDLDKDEQVASKVIGNIILSFWGNMGEQKRFETPKGTLICKSLRLKKQLANFSLPK
jgi:hypothetical protein